jgi:hypothetical protein
MDQYRDLFLPYDTFWQAVIGFFHRRAVLAIYDAIL